MIDSDSEIVQKLKDRYSRIHPLIFQRSIERATTTVHLFDLLDSFPNKYPVVWDCQQKCWVHTDDLTQRERMDSLHK